MSAFDSSLVVTKKLPFFYDYYGSTALANLDHYFGGTDIIDPTGLAG